MVAKDDSLRGAGRPTRSEGVDRSAPRTTYAYYAVDGSSTGIAMSQSAVVIQEQQMSAYG